MEYAPLGTSGIEVSRICLGCMGFGDPALGQHGWTLDEQACHVSVKRALEAGVTFFDTAPVYQQGTSEQYLGRALRDLTSRDSVVVATKFTPREQWEIDAGIDGREHVRQWLDRSLERLGMDHVDLYICHMWDYHTAMEQVMEGLADAVRAGKVRAIGLSNSFAWQMAKMNFLARSQGWPEFVSYQGHYNLIHREAEREMVPFCQDQEIALTPYSPLAGGRLAHRPGTRDTVRSRRDGYGNVKYGATADEDAVIEGRVADLAEKRGVPMATVALAWLLRNVTAPVVGATTPEQLDAAVLATELSLTDEEAAWLEEPYRPHALVGVMAQNGKQSAGNVV